MTETLAPPPPPSPERIVPIVLPEPPRKRGIGRFLLRLFVGAILVGSILLNLALLSLVAISIATPFQTETTRHGAQNQTIAVYTVSGVIDGAQAARFEAFCDLVRPDRNVKAVVLRVDSPGGGVSESDQMHNQVQRLQKADKKVIVSMGGLAASGGYYISAGADEILAEETTTTGSIGVLAMWVTLRGTLQKIGAEPILMRSTHAKDWKVAMNPIDPPTERQRAHIQDRLDDMQKRFEKVVTDGRGKKLKPHKAAQTVVVENGGEPKQTDEIEPFNGKVYGPDEAMALGLVDAKGYLDEAIERASALAGLGDPRVIVYKNRPTLAALLRGGQEGSAGLGVSRELIDDLQTPRIMMMWKAQ
ncbi:MAG: S49 family peptidase [Planctomycetota bacterium]|nr:S49 family peptidase [Planctomycetota bacterium]